MISKQPKPYRPSEKDMRDNPLIGGSKGATMAGMSPTISRMLSARTRSKVIARTMSASAAASTRTSHTVARTEEVDSSGEQACKAKKTHEQQVRILERKPDVPDARELDRALGHNVEDPAVHRARPETRHSEYPVSRGGLNQESDHNKHNDPGQSGHKPPKPMPAQQKH